MSDQTATQASDIRAAAPVRPNASIISPVWDFLLVGGVSIFIIPFVMLPVWDKEQTQWLHFAAYCMIFFLNLPHFIHSYQLLYPGYIRKLTGPVYSRASKFRLFVSGVVAPIGLIAFLVYGVAQGDGKLLGYGTNFMLFTVGWHYVKQGYGIMIALSARKKVFFDEIEKKFLLYNAYITWIYSWFLVNTHLASDAFQGIPYSTVGLPKEWNGPALALFLIWNIVFIGVIVKKFDRHPTLSFNGLSAYFFSVYPWVLFSFLHPNIIIFVPALHSLQYILIVWKLVYERTKDEMAKSGRAVQEITNKTVFRKMMPFLFVGFLAGSLLFIALPLWLDSFVQYDRAIYGPSLFAYCFLIFLNIHHYFIDFAIWRKDNPEMKYLFK